MGEDDIFAHYFLINFNMKILESVVRKTVRKVRNGVNVHKIDTSSLLDEVKLYYYLRSKYGVFSDKPIPRVAIIGIKDVEVKE